MLLFKTFFGHSANEGIAGGLHLSGRDERRKEARRRKRERERERKEEDGHLWTHASLSRQVCAASERV